MANPFEEAFQAEDVDQVALLFDEAFPGGLIAPPYRHEGLETLLTRAAETGNVRLYTVVADLVASKGLDVDYLPPSQRVLERYLTRDDLDQDRAAFDLAEENSLREIMATLIERNNGEENPDNWDGDYQARFDRAFAAEDIKELNNVLDTGFDPDPTILYRAAETGNPSLYSAIEEFNPGNNEDRDNVRLLLERYLIRNDLINDHKQNFDALRYAIQLGDQELTLQFLARPGLALTQFQKDNLLFGAIGNGQLEVTSRLLDLGANINGQGGTLIRYWLHRPVEMVTLALQRGINLNYITNAIEDAYVFQDIRPEVRVLLADHSEVFRAAITRAAEAEAQEAARRAVFNAAEDSFAERLRPQPQEETEEEKSARRARIVQFQEQEQQNEAKRQAFILEHKSAEEKKREEKAQGVDSAKGNIDRYCGNNESLVGDPLTEADNPVLIFFNEAEKPAECYLASELQQTWASEMTKTYLSVRVRNNWENGERLYKLPLSGKFLDQSVHHLIFREGRTMITATNKRTEHIKYGRATATVYSGVVCETFPCQ